MSQPARLNRGIVNWYGMGWFLDEYKNHRMVDHGGDTISGFTSLLMRFPEQKLTIILLCNRVGVDKQRLGRSVADEFLSVLAENARQQCISVMVAAEGEAKVVKHDRKNVARLFDKSLRPEWPQILLRPSAIQNMFESGARD